MNKIWTDISVVKFRIQRLTKLNKTLNYKYINEACVFGTVSVEESLQAGTKSQDFNGVIAIKQQENLWDWIGGSRGATYRCSPLIAFDAIWIFRKFGKLVINYFHWIVALGLFFFLKEPSSFIYDDVLSWIKRFWSWYSGFFFFTPTQRFTGFEPKS